VRDHPRRVIHIVRVLDEILDYPEIDRVTEQMRIHVTSRAMGADAEYRDRSG